MAFKREADWGLGSDAKRLRGDSQGASGEALQNAVQTIQNELARATGSSGPAASAADPTLALTAAVGALLASAATGGSSSGTDLAALLAGALGGVAAASSSGGARGGGQQPVGHSSGPLQLTSEGSDGLHDAVCIPSSYVGWLKGRQGGMIRDIESRSGARVEIDQSTKEQGHCTVNISGHEEDKKRAYGLVVAEVIKVADQPGSNMDYSQLGTKLEIQIDPKFVGWIKGPRGKVVQDITGKSSTRVDVDQTGASQGVATVKIYGTHEGVQTAKELIALEINKVDPQAAAEISNGQAISSSGSSQAVAAASLSQSQPSGALGDVTAALTQALGRSQGGSGASAAAPASGVISLSGLQANISEPGLWDAVVVPASYVGWLKGRQGGIIREIENRSGATIDIDQTTKDQGHCTVNLRGDDECKKKGYGLVVAEVMKVNDQSGGEMDCSSIGAKLEIQIDSKFVGWIKGPRGKVVQDITARSSTRVDIDQSSANQGVAMVKIFGTPEGVQYAKDLIAFEISKVSPEAAAEITGEPVQAAPALTGGASESSASTGLLDVANALGQAIAVPGGGVDEGPNSVVVIPSSFVGWLKGKQGGMIREIEGRSGAILDVDQSTKDMGHCTVKIRGGEEEKKKAYGFVIAEVMKVADQQPRDGSQTYDCSSMGSKLEIQIDGKFVGWIKGPKGKVVQDITARTNTRVDVDQSQAAMGIATVKIYGTHEGVQAAKEAVAFELSKVNPEGAAAITGQPVAQPGAAASSAALLAAITPTLPAISGLQGLDLVTLLTKAAQGQLAVVQPAPVVQAPMQNPAAVLASQQVTYLQQLLASAGVAQQQYLQPPQ